MEGGSEVVEIVTAEVEDCRTGTVTYLPSLHFIITALVPRLGQRDPGDDNVGGGGRRSVVSRLIMSSSSALKDNTLN